MKYVAPILLWLGLGGSVDGAAVDWRQLAEIDLKAAYNLVRENHPAAHPAANDPQFRTALETAYASGQKRLSKVSDEGGFRALLRGFAVAFGDPHISVGFSNLDMRSLWTGLMFRYVGGEFRVSYVDPKEPEWLANAKLVGCDGVAATKIGAQRLGGFRAAWQLGAERALSAPLLLVDEDNPFLKRPVACRFQSVQGETLKHRLDWRAIDREELARLSNLERGRVGSARDALEFERDVAFIGMSSMNQNADPLIAEVERNSGRIANAKAIVIDLRGNGGGSSRKGEELIAALFGRSDLTGGEGEGSYHWRASPFVLETINQYAAQRAETYGADSDDARGWRSEADLVGKAILEKEPFAPPLKIAAAKINSSARNLPVLPMAQRAYVLTDNVCVSSCLMLVDWLRALGVRQLGWETNASRRYMEVRAAKLPSGRARLSTLQKVDFAAPNWFGPFRPDVAAPATLTTAAEVKSWAIDEALRLAGTH